MLLCAFAILAPRILAIFKSFVCWYSFSFRLLLVLGCWFLAWSVVSVEWFHDASRYQIPNIKILLMCFCALHCIYEQESKFHVLVLMIRVVERSFDVRYKIYYFYGLIPSITPWSTTVSLGAPGHLFSCWTVIIPNLSLQDFKSSVFVRFCYEYLQKRHCITYKEGFENGWIDGWMCEQGEYFSMLFYGRHGTVYEMVLQSHPFSKLNGLRSSLMEFNCIVLISICKTIFAVSFGMKVLICGWNKILRRNKT